MYNSSQPALVVVFALAFASSALHHLHFASPPPKNLSSFAEGGGPAFALVVAFAFAVAFAVAVASR
jgi:hypothetical protein